MEQRFDSAKRGDYHAENDTSSVNVSSTSSLLSSQLSCDSVSNHVKSFSLSLTLSFAALQRDERRSLLNSFLILVADSEKRKVLRWSVRK